MEKVKLCEKRIKNGSGRREVFAVREGNGWRIETVDSYFENPDVCYESLNEAVLAVHTNSGSEDTRWYLIGEYSADDCGEERMQTLPLATEIGIYAIELEGEDKWTIELRSEAAVEREDYVLNSLSKAWDRSWCRYSLKNDYKWYTPCGLATVKPKGDNN